MKVYNRLTDWDKIVAIAAILCFVFWFLSKTDFSGSVLFGVVYEMGVFPMMALGIICTGYFLIKWIINKFTLNKIYLYGFLLGVLTLLIMRLVYSIDLNGVTWMSDYNN